MTTHWDQIIDRFDEWTSPLRPCAEDVVLFSREVVGRALLLGVTAELLPLVAQAVDNDPVTV